MSNRQKSVRDRVRQSYRNAVARSERGRPQPGADGVYRRGSGANNFPYPSGGVARSIFSTLRVSRRGKRSAYFEAHRMAATGSASLEAVESIDLATLTRDDLRKVAKERGLANYGRLNKKGLLDLLAGA